MRETQRGYRPEDIKARDKSALDASFRASKETPNDIIELTDEDLAIKPEDRIKSTGHEFDLDLGTEDIDIDVDWSKADKEEAERRGVPVEVIKKIREAKEKSEEINKRAKRN
ncbi:MAG: hypothetical protein WC725_01015 [Patescibacteria group bacterium]|jgi:hypothetical protein